MSDNPTNGKPVPDRGPGDKAEEIAIEVDAESGIPGIPGISDVTGGPGSAAGEAASAAAPQNQQQLTARVSELETEVNRLTAEVARLDKEKQEHWDRLLRATAELDNVRKRARRDVEDAQSESITKVLKEMLPVVDNLERAVEHAEATGQTGDAKSGVLEGVKLVLRQFGHALERFNVTPVSAVGQPFDPNVHEAISQVETAEYPPGSVVQSLQKGYKIGERLLRPSLVVVAKAPPAAAPSEPGQSEA